MIVDGDFRSSYEDEEREKEKAYYQDERYDGPPIHLGYDKEEVEIW